MILYLFVNSSLPTPQAAIPTCLRACIQNGYAQVRQVELESAATSSRDSTLGRFNNVDAGERVVDIVRVLGPRQDREFCCGALLNALECQLDRHVRAISRVVHGPLEDVPVGLIALASDVVQWTKI